MLISRPKESFSLIAKIVGLLALGLIVIGLLLWALSTCARSGNSRITEYTDRAPTPIPVEVLRKASGRTGVWEIFARECVRRNYKGC